MKLLLLTSLLLSGSLLAQGQLSFQTRVVKDNLFIPWEITWGPDQHIWFTQKNGYICRLNPETSQTDTLWHQANTVILGEGGMLGMAVHPMLLSGQPYVYVAYEYESGGNYLERIQRLTYNAATNTLGSPLTLIDTIPGAMFHNGCRMTLADNYLFVATGDATVAARAQDLSSLNGKILRLNLDGTVPADNPIAGSYVYSWGHRNAQGLVFANGRLYSSEHGPNTDDEINIIEKGRNYGWPDVAGFCDLPAEMTFCADSNVVEPLYIWTPTIAPAGMDYYSHAMFPALQQSLILATLKDQKLYRLKLNSTLDGIDSVAAIPGVNFGRLRDVCIAPDGRIFISTSNSNASGSGAFSDRIVELYDSTTTGVKTVIAAQLSLSPNPAQDLLRISLEAPVARDATYQVLDAQGRMVQHGKWAAGKQELLLDLKSLAAGSYWLQLAEGGKRYQAVVFQKK